MFGDELFQTPLLRMCWKSHGLSREAAPLAANSPLILDRLIQLFRLNEMLHRKVSIILSVYQPSGCRDCASGHNLGNENNAPSITAAFFPMNVETHVYLVEIGVKRNWETPE